MIVKQLNNINILYHVYQENDNTQTTDLSVLFVIRKKMNIIHQHCVIVL